MALLAMPWKLRMAAVALAYFQLVRSLSLTSPPAGERDAASIAMPCVESCRTTGTGCRGTFRIRGGDNGSGFGALFFGYTVQQLRFAEMHCLSPCIDFDEQLAEKYYDKAAGNPWEHYFQKVCPSYDAEVNKLQCSLTDQEIFDMNYDGVEVKYYLYIAEISSIISRWYRLQPELQQELWDEWTNMTGSDEMPGQRKTPILGAHIRGADRDDGLDWRGGVTREGSGPALFLPEVQKFLDEFPLGVVYIATDDTEFAETIKMWPAEVARAVRMREMKRATPGKPLFGDSHQKEEGRHVLTDLVFLTWCDRLLSSTSELSWAAQWWAADTLDQAHSYCPENPAFSWNYMTRAVREPVDTGDCPRYDPEELWEGFDNEGCIKEATN